MNVFLTVFLAALSSCLLAPVPAPVLAQLSGPSEYFPPPQKGISIQVNAEKMPRLSDLLSEFSKATGMTIVSDETTRRMLESNCGLNQGVEVPPGQVYTFTESVLSYHGFLLYHLRSEAPRLLGITHPRALNEASGTIKPVYVPAESLAAWKDHPAFLLQTMVTLPNVDVRTLSNSMRQMFSDARTQQIVPIGNSNSMLITAPASMLTSMVAMFGRADEESAKAIRNAIPAAKPADPAPAPK
jgi:hypothetical protein